MEITLYQNVSEKNRLNKEFTDELAATAIFKDEVDIINPTLRITGDISIISFNYLYIKELNRYYYIDNIVSVRNNLWELKCSIDVLMTYKEGIKTQNALISRQENKYNLYLPDDHFKTLATPRIQVKAFPNSFTDEATLGNRVRFILTVAGG